MELYGSLHNISGSVTASAFSGSFKGDGGGLYNLPASGVTGLNLSQIASGNATASISSTGFTVNTNTTIQGNLSVTGSITATNYIVSSSVTYMTTSFASGSSAFGNDGNDVHQFTGSVQITGSISLNGQAIGTGKLDETTFQSYTSSISSSIGSLSSSIALTDVSQSNRLTTIEGNYATTGSNLFKGSQTISGSIIPAVSGSYDLGDLNHPFRHLYLSSASLYIDGTKVLGSTTQELTITTDTGQSIKILEAGSDSIILQSADGDIELKSSGGGDILLDPTNGLISIKGTTQIQDGFKITSSGGTNIVFGNSVIVSGSIELTGNVDGIDLQSFSSSVSASISSLLGGNTSLSSSIATTTSGLSSSISSLSSSVATTTSGLTSTITSVSSSLTSSIGSLSSSIATTTSGLSSSIGSLSSSVATTTNDLSSSVATTTLTTKNRVDSIEISTGSLNTFTGSINTTIKSKLDSESVISGSVQILITGTTGYSTFSSSISTSIGELSSSVATTTSGLSSSIGSLSSSIATTTLNTKNRVDSIETSTGSLNTFTSSASGRLSSLETASGSIRTDFNTYTGSNNTTNTTQDGRLTSIEGITGSISSLNTYTGSNNTVIGILQTSTSSLNSYTSSNTTNINAIHTSTGSFKSFTSSFDTAFGMSGADVTVKGNLTVSGTQTTVNSTTVAIGDNIIQLNGTGATNAGLVVRDATAPNTVSGSFLWDSTNDKWIAGALGSEDDVVLKTATQTLTNKTISGASNTLSNIGNGSLTNSSITIAGTSTSLGGTISAATILSGTGTVSGSAQIDLTATTNYASGILTRLNAVGVFSGSAQVTGIGNAQLTNSSVTVTAGTGMSGGGAVSLGGTVTLTNAGVTSITTNTGLSSNVSATGAVTITNTITNNNQLTNGAGYITGITSGNVTTALGFTPYNATNPSGYISSITSGNVTTALGFTPYNATNPNGYITSDSTKLPLAGGTMTGTITITNTDIRSNGTSNWTGDPGTQGKIQYHANRWYIVADSGSDRIVQFRRNGTDVSYIDNSGNFIGNASTATSAGSATSATSATTATFATNSSKLYSTDAAYSYTSGAPYYGYLTYDGTYWLYQVSPATPSAVRVARADTAGSAPNGSNSNSFYNVTAGNGNGIKFWDSDAYKISMGASALYYYGPVTDYSIKTQMNDADPGRGFTWGRISTAPIAALNATSGNMQIAGTFASSNYSGTSSGTNTGDQTNISGNAATATTATNSSQLNSLSKVQLWNNSGANHSTYQTFAAIPNFGVWFMQNSAAGDTPQSSSQYYVQTQGLGNDYAYGTYGLMTAVARDHAVKYTYYRTQENGTWGAWSKAAAGYADTAGSLSSMNISQFTNNSGYITGVTNISGTAASETLSTVTNRGSSTSQNITFSNGRKGLIGVYDAAQTQAIFAMGAAYILTDGGASGTIGNHYGLAWSYNPDYGGAGNNPQSKAGLNHQLLHMQAGVTTTAIGSGIWTSGGITCGTILPLSNNAHNLGSTGTRWANIYTNDLHLSNEGKSGGNEIDGTTGDWTIQEGQENLYIINNKNGKKFKMDLTEIE